MVDTAITGMFGRNTNASSLSETKKAETQVQTAFADVMAKSMNFLPVSSGIKGVNQMAKSNKTSIDNVFVKNDLKVNSNKDSKSLDTNEAAKTDVLSKNNETKGISQDKDKSGMQVCDSKEDIDEEEETVKNMMSEFIETVKKILDISDEEFQKTMSELGLTFVDLLEPNNVTNFIAQLSGKQDAISVITDAELSLNLKDIIQSVSDMMSSAEAQYGLSEEQFKNVAQICDDMMTENQVLADKMGSLQDNVKQSSIQEDAQMKSEEYVSDNSSLEQVISEKVTVSSLENKNSNEFADNSNNGKQGMFENNKNNTEINSDMTSGMSIAAQIAETFETAFANNLDDIKPVDIVRQVVTSIKLNLTSQLKSMEIALNPENLGKVNLLVSVREGVVTAKLIAENEQVKKALEGQLNVLKENMSNQGLKVEAVEVTVQNNAFQSQENFDGSNQQQQQANGAKKHIGYLNLSDDEEVTETSEKTTSINENSSVEFSA